MKKKIALIFAGQGAQHVGMGKDLAENSPVAGSLFEQADTFLKNGFKDICFSGPEEKLTDTSYCQPALYVHGLALFEILKSKLPDFSFQYAAGLSLGEFTAHAAAGKLSFAEGLDLVATRGRLMQEACEATDGGMVTLLGADEEQAREVSQKSGLEMANLNCPGQIVLSGSKELIPKAVEVGNELGLKRVIPLKVTGAYHSSLMNTARDGLEKKLQQIKIEDNAIPVYANISGTPQKGEEAIKDSLVKQVTGSVLWEKCIRNMMADGVEEFIELGPGKVLAGLCKRIGTSSPCLSAGTYEDLEGVIDELKR
ncbi:MAG: ACP S-malonyltransferase [Verrucomicrobiota bacterium]